MNSFSKLRQWIQKRMEGHNRTDFVILLLLGVLVMVIAIPTEGSDMKKERIMNTPMDMLCAA